MQAMMVMLTRNETLTLLILTSHTHCSKELEEPDSCRATGGPCDMM